MILSFFLYLLTLICIMLSNSGFMEATKSVYHQSKSAIEEEASHINRAKKDARFFAPIYKKYHSQILRFAYQRLDDKTAATDLTQQIFLKAMQNLSKYENRGLPFSSWLYRIAINELNQLFRNNKKLRTIALNEQITQGLVTEMEDEELSEKKTLIGACLKQLSADDFQLIEMRFFENRPFKEIGEMLNITENNSKVKTYRILKKLKAILQETK